MEAAPLAPAAAAGGVDLVTLFAIVVFSTGWFFLNRTPPMEPLVRLFFGTIMFMGAMIGILGFLLRLSVQP